MLLACSSVPADDGEALGPGTTPPPPGDETPGDKIVADDVDAIEVTPTEIDFSAVKCGAADAKKTITIKNTGTRATTYSVELPSGSVFELASPATGELAPGAETTIDVLAKINAAGDNAAELVVSTPSRFTPVKVTAKGTGGKLEFLPSLADVGDVRYQNGGSVEIALKNNGTETINLASFTGTNADFDVTWAGHPAPLVLEPNATKFMNVKLSSGATASGPLNTALVPKVDGPHCGATPELPAKGQRVNLDVIISNADFGKQNCNTGGQQKDVVISNYTAFALTYTAALKAGDGSAFTIVSGASDSIPAGTSSAPTTRTVKIAMKPVGQNLTVLSDVLDLNVSGIEAPSGGPRTANVSADIRGVILSVDPTSLHDFDYWDRKNYKLTNAGNEPANINTSFSRDSGTTQAPAWNNNPPGSVPANGSANGSVRFQPIYKGNYAGTYTFFNTNGTPVCNGNPTLHLQGSVN